MLEMRVWAPNVRRVELDSNSQSWTMFKREDGWWILDAPFIQHGVDYAFRLDGEGPFPDPRSPWQPEGVQGASRWVDHDRFAWSDSHWRQPPLGSAVIHELHVGTFTPQGTCDAVIDHLDDLVDLGITHVELMPVAEFSGTRGWGYDGVDLYAPHHAYGGPEALKRLVNACHQRGLAVLLDVVYNHLGPQGNYLNRFGPYFTDRYKTPWGEAINLDGPGSDEVRRFFLDNALMWLRDYHLDGLRIDAVHAIMDTSAVHFLEQLATEVDDLEAELGRHLVLIAESDLNDPRVVRAAEQGGCGIDAQWNEDFHHALQAVLTGERDGYYQDFGTLADLAKVLTEGMAYDGRYSTFRRRCHGRPAVGLSGNQFIGCLQNHDQVGNRALGERASQLLSHGQLKIGAALVMTSPFVPMLFQGEEWGASTPFLYFTDHQDAELGEAVKLGRRNEFSDFDWKPEDIPDPQAEETWLRSKLDWEESSRPPHTDLRQWHRSLISLRRRLACLTNGRFAATQVEFDEDARWLIMRREPALVICNFSEFPQTVRCPAIEEKEMMITSDGRFKKEHNSVSMPGHATGILLPKEIVERLRD
ncbi:MAG: malto-oligosyltrehalose trehalohydrolase [Planctomycetota bacterium]